jgi:hypothetical protein
MCSLFDIDPAIASPSSNARHTMLSIPESHCIIVSHMLTLMEGKDKHASIMLPPDTKNRLRKGMVFTFLIL